MTIKDYKQLIVLKGIKIPDDLHVFFDVFGDCDLLEVANFFNVNRKNLKDNLMFLKQCDLFKDALSA